MLGLGHALQLPIDEGFLEAAQSAAGATSLASYLCVHNIHVYTGLDLRTLHPLLASKSHHCLLHDPFGQQMPSLSMNHECIVPRLFVSEAV